MLRKRRPASENHMEGGQKKKTQKNETEASAPNRRYANHRGMKSSVQNNINHLSSEGNNRLLKSDVGTSKKKVASALLITVEQGPECQVQEASFTKQPSNVIKQGGGVNGAVLLTSHEGGSSGTVTPTEPESTAHIWAVLGLF